MNRKFVFILFGLLLFTTSCEQSYKIIELEIDGHVRDKAHLYLPPDQDHLNQKIPLFVLLHGYNTDRQTLELQFGFQSSLKKKNYAFLTVNGVRDSSGKRYWNASKACCNLDGRIQNDVDYLSRLINKATANYKINPEQVYFLGFSNGGFMSYRMACEKSELVAGLISIAGTAADDYESCKPVKPINVIHIHGSKDDTIFPNGGTFLKFAPHIGAAKITELWTKWNECTGTPAISKTPDATYLTNSLDKVTHFNWSNCKNNSFVELQLHQNDGHIIFFVPGFIDALIEKLVKNQTVQNP